ncbi:MAG: preprotein translocase subunit SecE [Candidatus Pacebacteria bacterium]|nr:preprotein translocase subunit SecE [Candidatus Paceibacterota bacterium]
MPKGAFLKRKMGKITDYLKQSVQELKKVNWPTRKETIRYTLGVLGLSFIVAIILGFIDFGLIKAMGLIIQ